ncbi:MAG: UDP-N-acetylmuramoyl-tripeptide--D-alanyl-D-alanine ligase [Candidatus Omnitrophica bacterium]|nr:UDP-N-acetylmuramoyl-tripeptide--D-alanyl-D-alanine ligase [Candidatus Omnitrophota bacterium]
MFTIEDILKGTGGEIISGRGRSIVATGVSIDSRTMSKGELFIAIKGENFDGHNFLSEAFKKGACAVIVMDRSLWNVPEGLKDVPIVMVSDTVKALGDLARFHRKRFDIPVVAVTGSNGKTTVKDMISFLLQDNFEVLKTEGTKNNQIGVPLTLLKLDGSYDAAVLEIGMNHKGEIARLTEIAGPSIGLITNIGPSHIEFFKDLDGILEAKLELARLLKKDGTLILNGDDKYLARVNSLPCKIVRFGEGDRFDVAAIKVERIDDNWSFVTKDGVRFKTQMLGRESVANALGAIACASLFGIPTIKMAVTFSEFILPKMRMSPKSVNGIRFIDDTYNANPLSFKCAVDTLANIKIKGKRIIVCGDMLELGKESRRYHAELGRQIATSGINILITVGKLSEDVGVTAKELGMEASSVWHFASSDDAARALKGLAHDGDTILVKGSRRVGLERIIDYWDSTKSAPCRWPGSSSVSNNTTI